VDLSNTAESVPFFITSVIPLATFPQSLTNPGAPTINEAIPIPPNSLSSLSLGDGFTFFTWDFKAAKPFFSSAEMSWVTTTASFNNWFFFTFLTHSIWRLHTLTTRHYR